MSTGDYPKRQDAGFPFLPEALIFNADSLSILAVISRCLLHYLNFYRIVLITGLFSIS